VCGARDCECGVFVLRVCVFLDFVVWYDVCLLCESVVGICG